MSIVHQLLLFRICFTNFNFEQRTIFQDRYVMFVYVYSHGIAFITLQVLMCYYDSKLIWLPMSVIHCFVYCWGLVHSHGIIEDQSMSESFNEHWDYLIATWLLLLVFIYTIFAICLFYEYTNIRMHNQLSLCMQNFKDIVSNLNEAIISKTEKGHFGYCNDLGLTLI